jgi:hypothetical protein
MLGRGEEVLEPAYEAASLYRSTAATGRDGNYYARLAVASARIGAHYQLSNYRAFASELQSALQELRATENRAGLLHFAANESLLDELLDRPKLSIARLEQQREQLPRRGFGTYHALHLMAVCATACAAGEHAWGIRWLEQDWPRFVRSPMHRTANIALLAYGTALRLLISHRATGGTSALDARVPSLLATMAKSHLKGAAPAVDLLRGRLAFLDGDRQRASELFGRSAERARTVLEGERARYAHGFLIGGERGRELQAQAERALSERGMVNPARRIEASFPELFLLR